MYKINFNKINFKSCFKIVFNKNIQMYFIYLFIKTCNERDVKGNRISLIKIPHDLIICKSLSLIKKAGLNLSVTRESNK